MVRSSAMKKNLNLKRKNHIKGCFTDRVFDAMNFLVLLFIFIVVAYPLIIVISSSFSNPSDLVAGKVFFLPVNPTLMGYKMILTNEQIGTGVMNSVFYTVVGSLVNIVMTVLAAYPLSRKDFRPRTFISLAFAFTMWFSGGLIPTYILIRDLGMYNSRWVMIIPTAMAVWNMVIVRSYFQNNIPESLFESAKIDGCDDKNYLLRIVIPVSKPVLSVITLYYVVGNWNAFFNAYLYLQKSSLQPLQVVLRDILLMSQMEDVMTVSSEGQEIMKEMSTLLKYSLVVVASLPMALLYLATQKYFTKGIMVGSVKG